MLDNGTKKRIDSTRDILVGKVPDPKSQVEQITIAMIYKFMDDMDNQTEELGGKATFFAGEFKQYAWGRLLDRKFSGHERLLLYAEGIEKMNINENIPQLFRHIFKGAFLPYRDPETLNLFLKEINGFTYDHSERLGDAFEYLLSVLSSQGDAGQFRTPRHIIDFIVEIVNPAKEDTVLDPACGTAGFLISSYKHILHQNTKTRIGDLLTTDDKGRLMANFCGYDISPDMVRLSLVNMYLHSFANPSIHEYDTLTSEDRWDERYDVIMANPPFMSPKGGIRPHSRFTIKAKRSEVLFVDYIAEHLNVHGRAGVIVPEGIVFQSQNAYKNLRKMLVDEGYLYAVISLPAGIFNPYAGVKTSILLMDKTLAKKTGEILFVKVSNDGFDLGAQRRPIDKNDLPQALKIVKGWKQVIGEGKGLELSEADKALAHIVAKEKIAESGDYNLSGDRYKEVISYANLKWPMVEFKDVCTLEYGASLPTKKRKPGPFPVVGSNGITGWHDSYLIEGPTIIVGRKGSAGEVVWIDENCFPIDTTYYVRLKNEATTNLKFLFSILKNLKLTDLRGGGAVPGLNRNDVYQAIKLPLPPMEVQEKIVAELDGYQKIIDGAKQVVENYKPAIKIDPDWPMVELGEVTTVTSSKRIFQNDYVNSGVPFYRTKEIVELSQGKPISLELYISKKKYDSIKEQFDVPKQGDILISAVGTIGISWVVSDNREFYFKDGNLLWIKNIKGVLPKFLKCVFDYSFGSRLNEYVFGASYKALTIVKLKQMKIPLPPLEIQQKIVAEIESEQELVEANKKLIEIFEKKIKDKVCEVWGE
jgi:type I restriction enzyme M protein